MYDVSSMEGFAEMFGVSSILSMISAIPGMLVSLAIYIATAIALYTIANRRGISKPWLAWIPVLNVWTLGAIADHYRLACGTKKSRRKVLLGTNIAMSVLAVLVIVLCVAMLVSIFANADLVTGDISEEAAIEVGLIAIGMLLICLPTMVVAVIHAVFYYIALYEVFKSCDPGNAVLYLVLSIFISICQPIFLVICRNKDGGMPKPQPQIVADAIPQSSENPWEPKAAPQEPWEKTEE